LKKALFLKPCLVGKIIFSNEKIFRISPYFEKIKFPYGTFLQKEEEPIEYVYLIKKGEVELKKVIPIPTKLDGEKSFA
jgi:hypothetical protein